METTFKFENETFEIVAIPGYSVGDVVVEGIAHDENRNAVAFRIDHENIQVWERKPGDVFDDEDGNWFVSSGGDWQFVSLAEAE